MSNKTVFVPVDPEGFGCGLLLGLIIRYWRQLLMVCLFIFGCIFVGGIVQAIITSISTANAARVAATQVVTQIAETNRQIDELVNSQDYYLAASLATSILSKDATNSLANNTLKRIAGYVPGGLAVGGSSGIYYPFSSAESTTFVSGLVGNLVGVSPDGRLGLIVNGENHDIYSVIDFANGRFMRIDDGIPSTDLTKVELYDASSGIYFTPMKIKNINDGKVQEIDCAAYHSFDKWSDNSRLIIQSPYQVVDTQSGNCRNINVPDLKAGTVLVGEEKMWIVLPGDFTSMAQGQLFTANIDGSGLKKLTDLPIHGRDQNSRTFLSPDSSAIYMSEGILVSTRTGQVVSAIPNAIGWLITNPTKANVTQVRLTIQPESGPRGTRFSFLLEGGEPGVEVSADIEPGGNSSGLLGIGTDGRIDGNSVDFFGAQTGITTQAGIHTVTIYTYPGPKPIAVATFTVTEP